MSDSDDDVPLAKLKSKVKREAFDDSDDDVPLSKIIKKP
jgi:hypothetical protein